ncbi:PREDICTED: RNA exonuclease 1 homolog [Apaloderma vittatum]|uniref:RNA exonuclease 1 homolog n=1 Tax=Apaloderma vittatum TaxID=57397 RepID=UPI0005219357|nr:PREDICTED: RNA exonuclease 1 homolog [Apaloderma vittatum]
MSSFRSEHVFPEKLRIPSAVELEDSDAGWDLDIDEPPQAVNKKPRISSNCTNRSWDKEVAEILCDSAMADIPGSTEEKSEEINVLRKNTKVFKKSEKLHNVSLKANDVNNDIVKVLKLKDALAYSEEKHTSSTASFEAGIWNGILKQGHAENSVFVEASVQQHTSEDCVTSRGVTPSALGTGHSSKDGTTVQRPYKGIINREENQSIEENRANNNPEEKYSYPSVYLNKKEHEISLLSSSAEETECRWEETEVSDSDDPLEECRKIFEEFEGEARRKNRDKQDHGGEVEFNSLETKLNAPGKKRRIAHRAKFDVHNRSEVELFTVCPQQWGCDVEIQQIHCQAMDSAAAVRGGQALMDTASEQKTMSGLSATPFQSIGPLASVNLLEVQPIEISSAQVSTLLEGDVVVAAIPSGPSLSSFMRTIPVSYKKKRSLPTPASKVPPETRQRYISFFFAECIKICSTMNEAFDKALIAEQSVYDRCGNKKMYLNFAVQALKKLRDHGQLSNCRSSSDSGSVKSEEEQALTGYALYEHLKDYLLTEEQLNENNFPRPDPEKNGSAILSRIVNNADYDAFKRVCCRCGEVYAVTSSGEHRRKEECNYHSGRVLKQRFPADMEKHYSCCQRLVGSPGCQVAKLHVHDGRGEKLEGFMKTLTKSPPLDGNYGVYALDCEMCYTTHGLELTRVTVVDAKLQIVYDTLVKPDGKVVDYDARLSGVKEDDLKKATISLRAVQAILLNLFSADTVLIGHCLEKGLFVLKLIHDKVVDTSVVFPHRLGLPHRRTMRSLMAEYLRKIRQDDVAGHNSREDATACMELILWKVKEDNRIRK